jgi:hypothetical protein
MPETSNDTDPQMPDLAWSRRAFLVGALATGALAACGGSSDDSGSGDEDGSGDDAGSSDDTSSSDGESTATLAVGTYTVVQRFPQHVQVPGGQRLPMSLSTGLAELVQDGPETLGAVVTDLDGNEIGPRITAKRRDVSPGPYYDFRTAVVDEGFYALVVDGGPEDGANFQVTAPAEVAVPGAGESLPPLDTPTVDDDRGVDPICTREPDPCPFHDVTLTEALAGASDDGRVVAYYVGTPAFCQTGSCAPALESMIDLQEEFADSVTFVHAEVYTDTTATEIAPAVEAVGLDYEPVLFVTGPDGVIIERLDAVWNVTELRETLLRATG